MIRTLVLAAAIGSFAVPAFAASVTVNVAGLDAKTAHAKIIQAASTACSIAMSDTSDFDQYYSHAACVTEAANRAEAQLEAQQHSAKP